MATHNNNRIKLLRNNLGLTQEEFANRLGITRQNAKSTVSRWETGDRQPTKFYAQIVKEFGVSLDWLVSGEGEMFLSQEQQLGALAVQVFDSSKIGVKDLETMGYIVVEDIEDSNNSLNISYLISTKKLNTMGIEAKTGDLFFIKMKGNSMEPTLRNGDECIIAKNRKHLYIDKIYALIINGEVVIKRYCNTINGNSSFTNDNPIYQTLLLDSQQVDKMVIGQVILCTRNLLD